MLGDVEGHAGREAVDGALELVVGERLNLAAAVADHVVMVMAVGAGGLVARGVLADLDAGDQTEADELLEHAVHRGPGDAAPVAAQRVLDVVGAQCARLMVEQADDRRTRAAATETGLGEAAFGVLGPRLHHGDGSDENGSRFGDWHAHPLADGELILIAGALLAAGMLASLIAGRLRVPGLLLFIFVGMAVGSDGLGFIEFDDYELARRIGIIALALILFEGGLTSGLLEIRPVLAGSDPDWRTLGSRPR